MTSFREQMRIHEAARSASASLERAARAAIRSAFNSWDSGDLTGVTVRYRLESIVRSAYRTGASVAAQTAVSSSEIPDWSPEKVFSTDYLQELIQDVRRNLRDVKSGKISRGQAELRMEHSAGVAVQRGYTDQIISSFAELKDFGLKVKKYWVANFVDNTPCPSCQRLHGTSVALEDTFKEQIGESKVYRDLVGPPRHPRCQCKLFIFVTSLENAFTIPDFEAPQESSQMMSTEQVKKFSPGIFSSIKATLKSIVSVLRRKK